MTAQMMIINNMSDVQPNAANGEFAPLHAMVEEAERRHIRSALERTGGSVMKTSELLGISRKTLWEKMKKVRIGNGSGQDSSRD